MYYIIAFNVDKVNIKCYIKVNGVNIVIIISIINTRKIMKDEIMNP